MENQPRSLTSKRAYLLGMIFTLGAACLWGSTYAVIKLDLSYYSPYDISFLRAFFASVTLLFFFFGLNRSKKKNEETRKRRKFFFFPRDRKLILLLLAASLFGATGFWTLLNLGVLFVDPDTASFLVALYPLIAIVFASVFLKEKLTPIKAGGVVLGIIGTFLIVAFGQRATLEGTNPILGEIFSALAAFSWAAYMVTTKSLMGKKDATSGEILDAQYVTFTTFVIAIIPTLAISQVSIPSRLFEVNATGLGLILYLGIFASALAFVIFNVGMKWIGVSRAAVNQLLFPCIAVITSYLLLGEVLNPAEIAGIALIIFGILIAQLLSKE